MSAAALPIDPWIALLTGSALGPYQLVRPLGRGNFGVVFDATNATSGARVAIKILVPGASTDAVLDFDNEGVLLQHLDSCEGVIGYITGGSDTVPLLAGSGLSVPVAVRYHVLSIALGSLDELILDPVERAKLPWEERLRLWRSAVIGARQMHARAVAHRDLKCSNCLVLDVKKSRVKLADLGRAKHLTEAQTRPIEHYLHGRGDLRFAPPECLLLQAGAEVDHFLAADYYGLGSLLVELATGQPLTSLTLGDFNTVIAQSRADLQAGVHRDLAGLELRYRSVLKSVVETMPKAIRKDAMVLLTSLCHPVPEKRLIGSPFSRDRLSKDRLEWVLRRIDIMIRRLEVDALQERRQARRQKAAA